MNATKQLHSSGMAELIRLLGGARKDSHYQLIILPSPFYIGYLWGS
jgi:hypothetical protein